MYIDPSRTIPLAQILAKNKPRPALSRSRRQQGRGSERVLARKGGREGRGDQGPRGTHQHNGGGGARGLCGGVWRPSRRVSVFRSKSLGDVSDLSPRAPPWGFGCVWERLRGYCRVGVVGGGEGVDDGGKGHGSSGGGAGRVDREYPGSRGEDGGGGRAGGGVWRRLIAWPFG